VVEGVVTGIERGFPGRPGRVRPYLATFSGTLTVIALLVGSTALAIGLATSAAGSGGFVVLGPQPGPAVSPPVTRSTPPPPVEPPSDLIGLRARVFATGLEHPTAAVEIPGTDRWFVLERRGRVRVVSDGHVRPEPALDIAHLIRTDAIERGLLGIALHPGWQDNGRVFLSYTDDRGWLLITEFRSDPQALTVDVLSARVLLEIEHPEDSIYHLGGPMAFGPDGYLWIGVGDGSNPIERDSAHNGANPFTLQGSLVRIDVDAGTGYGIPTSNPFADGFGGAPEVWAFGFRNPWTFSFDEGRVIVADVGDTLFEEINVIPLDRPGRFYGWSWWEGNRCLLPIGCGDSAVAPDHTFPHSEVCAIIGGRVYRGSAIPELRGQYVYGDLCSGRVALIDLDGGDQGLVPSTLSLPELEGVTGFAADSHGELYAIQFPQGRISKIEPVRLGPDAG